jgi:DNA repair protein RadD
MDNDPDSMVMPSKTAFTLRDYQVDVVEGMEAAFHQGLRPCAVSPTGSGKTVMIAELVRRLKPSRRKPVVVMCHRLEILDQLQSALQRHLGKKVERIEAGGTPVEGLPMYVGMVPTMRRRMTWLERHLEGAVVIGDEAHHMGSSSWQAVRDVMQPRLVGGFTATPIRPDGFGLSTEDWDQLVLGPEPKALIESGALVPYRMFASRNSINTAGMRSRAGDYEMDEMARRARMLSGSIVGDWKRYNPDAASTISVGVTVEHAEEIARIYRAAGVNAACVTGSSSRDFREDSFAAFRSGDLQVLVSCALVDEGLDVPSATCLQLLRPTQSLRLYRQLIGRVMRPHEGKSHAVILDHTDNWRRLPLPDESVTWQLDEPYEPEPRDGEAMVDQETQQVEIVPPEMTEQPLQEIETDLLLVQRLDTPRQRLLRGRASRMNAWLNSIRR